MSLTSAGPVATWVVGASGLLGSAVVTQARRRHIGSVVTSRITWVNPGPAQQQLEAAFDQLVTAAGGHRWQIVWCAGAGVTGTSAEDLYQEVSTFSGILSYIERQNFRTRMTGSLFLASSAGGVYSGSSHPPFTENHVPQPLAPYGRAKLEAEATAVAFAERSGVPVFIGRLANLYGPGQDLAKQQGLVSHICRSYLTGQPLSVYVSLDTVRDYLFVTDAAGMVLDGLERLSHEPSGTAVTKILASQNGVTIAALLGESRRLFKRAPRIALGSSAQSKFQTRDLRLKSVVWPELDQRALTPLPVGIAATFAELLRLTQQSRR